MLGQRKSHDLPLTLANAMSDVVARTEPADHRSIIMHHHEGFDFVLIPVQADYLAAEDMAELGARCQGRTDRAPDQTAFLKELLVPGSAK